jgi:NitT/TauT family transport system substrate-binding protein
MRRFKWRLLAVVAVVAMVGAACGEEGTAPGGGELDPVTVQLKWVTQAQFAGYYAANEKGFYDEENLDVTIIPGGPDIVPEQVVAGGGAEFGLDWLPSLLSARDQGVPLVNIAQIFTYSGMRQVSFKDTGISSPADYKGKKIAVWFGGNEFALLATLEKYKLDRAKDLRLVAQPFDMNLLLKREVAAASAMTYNEYKQVLDAGVKPEDLVVIDFNQEGTAMLEDGIFAKEDWLKDAKNQEVAARFLRASLRGWEYCRDNAAECVDIVLKQSPTLGKDHQTWMMAEINKLIWGPPTPTTPFGKMDPAAFQRTADIALRFGVIKKAADASAYTHTVWEKATKK